MATISIDPATGAELRALERTASAFSVRVSRLVLLARVAWPKLLLFESILMEAGMPVTEAPEMVRHYLREIRATGA